MENLRGKVLPGVIHARCGDNVSRRQIYRLRRRYHAQHALPLPCTDHALISWWKAVCHFEAERRADRDLQRFKPTKISSPERIDAHM